MPYTRPDRSGLPDPTSSADSASRSRFRRSDSYLGLTQNGPLPEGSEETDSAPRVAIIEGSPLTKQNKGGVNISNPPLEKTSPSKERQTPTKAEKPPKPQNILGSSSRMKRDIGETSPKSATPNLRAVTTESPPHTESSGSSSPHPRSFQSSHDAILGPTPVSVIWLLI
jgi:hypothetical protein